MTSAFALPTGGRHLVINALNLSTGGGRTVLREFLGYLADALPDDLTVSCFVRKFDDLPVHRGIFYRIPNVPTNPWLARLWFESFGLAWALRHEPVDIFLSLQGSGARLKASRRLIYCHNPLPMAGSRLLQGATKLRIMRRIYDALYRFTIRRNDCIIVQQAWLRDSFRTRYGLYNAIVAHPVDRDAAQQCGKSERRQDRSDGPYRIIYPFAAYPYKNAEVVCEAVARLEAGYPGGVELLLTVHGNETSYAARLFACYGGCPAIRFVGPLAHERLLALYENVDLLVFPSLIETWGLPISEAKSTGLPILAADLPYARETVGDCAAAGFFDPFDAPALAEAIDGCWSGKRPLGAVAQSLPAAPFAPDWQALVAFVITDQPRLGVTAWNGSSLLDQGYV